MGENNIIKVSSKSTPNKVAGYIAMAIKDQEEVQLQMIGAGAVNQSVKALAIARRFVKQQGIDLACLPSFEDLDVGGRETTGMKLTVKSILLSA